VLKKMASDKAVAGKSIAKSPTGIKGFDEIIDGGLPKGRTTLVCGSAGCGKTLLSMEFIARGASEYREPGVYVSFEETPEELISNFNSLDFDIRDLIRQKKLSFEYIHIDKSEIEETGEYDLEGLFIRLKSATSSIGAKRIVLDTIEALFAGFNEAIIRAELRRLFRWLKDEGLTAIVTGEKGENTLTRYGLEEYVADCVIVLDHRITNQMAVRRLRVVKYRGSVHGTDEYPFLIDERGINVLPITSLGLAHKTSNERISSGIKALDEMMEGKGYYKGSSILISGSAGTGKTSMASQFVEAACRRGERCLYFTFEESPNQVIRNMLSIGLDLEKWTKSGKLQFHAARPSMYGLEMHLAVMHKTVKSFKPDNVVIDPISNLISIGSTPEVRSMLTRLMDFLKVNGTTTIFTNLASGGAEGNTEQLEMGVSSLMDTWISMRDIESDGERNRGIYILKSRGMAHSNQVREFFLTDNGIKLTDVYIGSKGVLTGSARLNQEAQDEADRVLAEKSIEKKTKEMMLKKKLLEAEIESMRAKYESEEGEMRQSLDEEKARLKQVGMDRLTMAEKRGTRQQRKAR